MYGDATGESSFGLGVEMGGRGGSLVMRMGSAKGSLAMHDQGERGPPLIAQNCNDDIALTLRSTAAI